METGNEEDEDDGADIGMLGAVEDDEGLLDEDVNDLMAPAKKKRKKRTTVMECIRQRRGCGCIPQRSASVLDIVKEEKEEERKIEKECRWKKNEKTLKKKIRRKKRRRELLERDGKKMGRFWCFKRYVRH